MTKAGIFTKLIAASFLLAGAAVAPAAEAGLDLIIRNGTVYDGTGSAPRRADIGIGGGRILFVGAAGDREAKTEIDARGLTVAPGFVDPHSHVLESVTGVEGPFLAPQILAQGITTSSIGADGFRSPDELRTLFAALKAKGSSTNHFCYVGHNGVRKAVMGHEKRAATEAEMDRMKALVREGMAMGCVGLSAGLMYDPGMFSPREEIVALAREVKPFDGTFDSHSRDPVKQFLASELETAEIGIAAGIPAKLGHLKAVGLSNKGKSADLVARIDALRAQGHDIVADIYPYDGAQTNRLANILVFPGQPPIRPSQSLDSVIAALRTTLADPAAKAALRDATNNGYRGGFSWVKAVGYDSIRIVDAPGQPDLVGKYLSLMAEAKGEDPFDTMVDLLLNAKGTIIITAGAMVEEDVQRLLVQPWDMISSDGSYIGKGSVYQAAPHPRSSGSFARVLGHYSRDLKLFPLAEAIRKMTSLPARHLRLYDRGEIAVGKAADIAIFDPAAVADKADYVHPERLAVGMKHVLVGGIAVWRDGAPTGATPGAFIARQPSDR
ncbi:N-acyl-D-amino-acid deacylase family protein [Sphingosinicella rhizophila]|uniref:Amidohydrolase family protein n=1 Tax=Sphingosinicella rhizophila TaxID=3050082 RepID=A0ABU3Q627_9SPHN|nr:amidohydrolase family protein [Sphingosinicella sp. GR2756]MDT9598863.1 amidohydrolase family protein [Sphingosinicella sp. GR2756]